MHWATMLAFHSFWILDLPTSLALLQGSFVCLRPKRFLRTTNQTPKYYHVAYVTNRVLQHGLNHHRQLPSRCYSTWQQTHVDILPVNQHWEDDTGFQWGFTVFWQQRVCGRTNSIPLGKKSPWNPGGRYTVVGTGSCPQIYLPCPISSFFSFPGLLVIAPLWATQVHFPFLKLLIQAQQPWPSGPSLITLQPSAEYRFSFCIKYYQLLVLLCPVSSLSFPCLFLLPCWKSASCPPIFNSDIFPFEVAWAQTGGLGLFQGAAALCRACQSWSVSVQPQVWTRWWEETWVCTIRLHALLFCEWKSSCAASTGAVEHPSDFSSLWGYM